MTTSTFRVLGWASVALAAATGCNGGGKDDDTGPTGGGGDAEILLFLDANNYSYEATLALTSVDVQAEADCVVDWSGFTLDYRGRPLDPTQVDRITLASIGLDYDTLIDKINTNTLLQSDIGDYREGFPSGETQLPFSEMSILGAPFDPANEFKEDASFTWLLTMWKDNDRGVSEILTSLVVIPVDAESESTIRVANDSAVLDFSADLSETPIVTVADASPYELNWQAVNTDVHGAPFDDLLADTLRIANLPVSSIAEVEELFLRLDIEATETYYLDVYSDRSADDLAAAESVDGTAFPGFTADGTWVLSFECTSINCFSPAPLLLSVVEVQ